VSNSDTFIDEVTEEVRRDRLFALMRRYGWIAVAAVVLLVAAAAWNEWQKAQSAAQAEAFGDTLIAALDKPDATARAAALDGVGDTPEKRAIVAMFAADQAEGAAAAQALEALSQNVDLPQVYRDLALLKFLMRDDAGLTADVRLSRLEPLTIPGAPYRLLALEQSALAQVALGETDTALTVLNGILSEDRVSEGLRRRVSQLIVALGGSLDAA